MKTGEPAKPEGDERGERIKARRRKGGGKVNRRRWLSWGGWIALVLVLGGHWLLAEIRKSTDGTPQGIVAPEHLQTAAFWVPLVAGGLMSLLGMWWASKAYSKHERSGLQWMKRAFVFSLIGCVVLGLASFDPDTFPREWLAVVAAGVFGVETTLFAFVARRENLRGDSTESRASIARADAADMGIRPRAPADATGRDA